MRAAVLGHPIAHSLSPVLHRAAYRALGLDWQYDALDVTSAQLPAFVASLDATWAGLSLTMPLKQAVLPLLHHQSAMVRRVGAANTVVLRDGVRSGHNTDVHGMVRAIRAVAPGVEPASVGVVGAGATATAAVAAAAELGAGSVVVTARRPEAAAALAAHEALAEAVRVTAVPWERRADVLSLPCVVVTLPGDAAAPLHGLVPARPGLLLDVTYDPWPTTLAAAWLTGGGQVVPGHQMLLWQATRQVELMTGRPAPVDAMAAALERALSA